MKKVLAVAMAMALTASVASVSMASSYVKCTVTSVEDSIVTMDCKKADKLSAGQDVKVKAAKRKAIEGC